MKKERKKGGSEGERELVDEWKWGPPHLAHFKAIGNKLRTSFKLSPPTGPGDSGEPFHTLSREAFSSSRGYSQVSWSLLQSSLLFSAETVNISDSWILYFSSFWSQYRFSPVLHSWIIPVGNLKGVRRCIISILNQSLCSFSKHLFWSNPGKESYLPSTVVSGLFVKVEAFCSNSKLFY